MIVAFQDGKNETSLVFLIFQPCPRTSESQQNNGEDWGRIFYAQFQAHKFEIYAF